MSDLPLDELLWDVTGARRFPPQSNPRIRSVVYDSREADSGSLFVALPGSAVNGHDFVEDAIHRGSSAVVVQQHGGTVGRVSESLRSRAVTIEVEDTRRALSAISSAFYGHPSKELHTIGVTGTDGKSTTVYIIHQLLEHLGIPSGFVSTPQIQVERAVIDNPFRNSTPESLQIHRILREMRDASRTHAVIEATSHGLSPRTSRLADVAFDCGVFTNLTHEHLEFHGSFEQYRSDKGNLFRALDASPIGIGVVNLDDDSAAFFAAVSSRPVFTYSIARSDADLFATSPAYSAGGARFDLHVGEDIVPVESSLPGEYNVSNTLAALLAVSKSVGVSVQELVPAVRSLRPQPGRMATVGTLRGSTVLVDYAHTPGAFAKLLPVLKERTPGRLIIVFGSAGERDVEKRALQGAVADEHADIVVLADEDPRGEDPVTILEHIAMAMSRHRRGEDLYLIPDRGEAIRHALSFAGDGDTVALLGKGHESSIIYADRVLDWDEAAVAKAALRDMGGRPADE